MRLITVDSVFLIALHRYAAFIFHTQDLIMANDGCTVVQHGDLKILLRLHRQQLGIFFVVEAQFVKALFAVGFNARLSLIRR